MNDRQSPTERDALLDCARDMERDMIIAILVLASLAAGTYLHRYVKRITSVILQPPSLSFWDWLRHNRPLHWTLGMTAFFVGILLWDWWRIERGGWERKRG